MDYYNDLNYVEYLIREKDKIVKYGITYDDKILEKLRREICKKCGIRYHKKEQGISSHIYKEDFLIEKMSFKKIGEQEVDYGCYDIYELDYYLIEEPYLSKIIKKFINGEIENLILLIHYGIIKNEKPNFDLEIKKLKRQIDNYIKSDDLNSLNNIMEEIQKISSDKKYNKNLDLCDQNDYIDKLKSIIVISKKEEMNYDEYEKFNKFTKKSKILEIKSK